MKLSCLIIDDEPSARKVLEEYISETSFLDLVGKAENPLKALVLMEEKAVDLIFLDMQMPKINGIDFLRALKNPPMVIISTAFSEYALQGFELDVLDYLLKPVSLERFIKASNKARDFFNIRKKNNGASDYFFIKCNNKFEKVMHDDLLYVEAANNYVLLQTKDKLLISYLTFKAIEETLPAEKFTRVHKSFIVSLSKIKSLNGEEIKIDKYSIPISRSMKDEVMEKILNSRLIKR